MPKRFAAGLLALGGLAACSGATQPAYLGTYDPGMLNYVAGKGPLYTEVIGNPFSVPDEALGQAITEAMVGAHFGPRIDFTTERDSANSSPYRVVFLFNPGAGVGGAEVCRNSGQSGRSAPADAIHVLAAFCAAGDRETSLSGRIDGVTDPRDPAFVGLIRQMTAELFPPRNPNVQDGADFDI